MTPTDKVRAALELGVYVTEGMPSQAKIKEALSELDGMVLVPVEPTSEMADEGCGMNGRTGWKAPLRPGMRVACTKYDDKERAENCYRAMIAPYVKGEKE